MLIDRVIMVGNRVLVADDDSSIVSLIATVLVGEGFEVITASDGREALEQALQHRPEIVLLDVMMPEMDGIEVCRRLRREPATAQSCVMLLTARTSTADKLMGLRAGADDYITKPFDPEELTERMRSALRRNREMAALSPLTGLPGNRQIEAMLVRLIEDRSPFALMHVDLDNFKAFNDHYGVLRGDMAIKRLARCIEDAMQQVARSRGFIGHVGGDDFVVVLDPELAVDTAEGIVREWDASVSELYGSVDAARGFIEVLDRQRQLRRYRLMSVSIGVASSATRPFADHLEVGDVAAEMKEQAKKQQGSHVATDRRAEPERERPVEGTVEEEPAPVRQTMLLKRSGRGQMPGRLWDQLAELAAVTRSGSRPEPQVTKIPNSVLIVDDEEDIRDVLRLHCELQGFPVVAEASDGSEAVEKALQHKPEFVILDYRMDEMDGDEAAARMRAADPEIKIVAFSGVLFERPDWADDFLSKEDIAKITPLLGRFLDLRPSRPSDAD